MRTGAHRLDPPRRGLLASRAVRLLGVVGLLLLAMCRACWLPDRSIERVVAPEEIVGTWVLGDASLALLERDGFERVEGRTHAIEFRADGTASVHTAVTWQFSGRYVEGDGTWALTPSDDGERTDSVHIELDGDGTTLEISEDDDGLVLWAYHVDPDAWEFMEHRRRE